MISRALALALALSCISNVRAAAAQEHQLLGTFVDSFKLLAIEHGLRVAFQARTRDELDGPFWRDYRRSVRVPDRWEDGDSWMVNYIGHPIHGAAAGYIWLEHAGERHPDISLARAYWASRAQATAWAAIYSVQFEFGPLSEASIGNVGLRAETTGWVDHVVTPVGSLALMVGEDALDRFFVKWVEGHTRNRFFRAALRMTFNPSRTLSNTTTGHLPWYREGRPLDWRRAPRSPLDVARGDPEPVEGSGAPSRSSPSSRP